MVVMARVWPSRPWSLHTDFCASERVFAPVSGESTNTPANYHRASKAVSRRLTTHQSKKQTRFVDYCCYTINEMDLFWTVQIG
ncbi:hypothetical protein HMPREF2861_11690 [Lactobacillus sp. HMSC068F07]|nr:hypothetical protein HMPREF2861_11690 [Lactobacillus sp. HMSC068F07]